MEHLFDPVLVFSSRLAIVACLASGEPMSFTELSKTTGLADGNLHVQTRKLADSGYLRATRTRGEGRERTLFRITEQGGHKLRRLIATLEQSLERCPMARLAPGPDDDRDASRVW